MLDHQYTAAELSFARLKGVDRARVAELRKASEQCGVRLYLASIEKTKLCSIDDFYDGYGYGRRLSRHQHTTCDVFSATFCLQKLVGYDDKVVAEYVDLGDLDDTMSVPEDAFDRDPDEDASQGYTGNEGASVTHFYRQTVCLHPLDAIYLTDVCSGYTNNTGYFSFCLCTSSSETGEGRCRFLFEGIISKTIRPP